ncbi:MAG: APC family permease [Pseudomonadota bacterium]
MNSTPTLTRRLTLPMLALFGLGTMVGAGIYVLVGEILAVSGSFAPWAFLLAASVAACTALSYGELARRFPKSAGEAVYVEQAFHRPLLTRMTGWAVALTGLVSSGTLAKGFAGYFAFFFPGSEGLAAPCFIIALGIIVAWGIGHTIWLAVIVTGLSILGLLTVLVVSSHYLVHLPEVAPLLAPASSDAWLAISAGAFVAFYAFIGFEDMVNVAEETRDPERIMVPAILFALIGATTLYLLVALMAVLASQELDLAGHPAPLAAMVAHAGAPWPAIIATLSMLSVSNSALAQLVMVSRVVYGMADGGHAPALLARVHPVRRTPLLATGLTVFLVVTLAAWFPLLVLAKATSLIVLLVFAVVNVALIRMLREGAMPRRRMLVPALGAILSVGLIAISLLSEGHAGH